MRLARCFAVSPTVRETVSGVVVCEASAPFTVLSKILLAGSAVSVTSLQRRTLRAPSRCSRPLSLVTSLLSAVSGFSSVSGIGAILGLSGPGVSVRASLLRLSRGFSAVLFPHPLINRHGLISTRSSGIHLNMSSLVSSSLSGISSVSRVTHASRGDAAQQAAVAGCDAGCPLRH